MRYNQLGDSDLKVSELGLGTMTYGQQNTQEQAHEHLSFAVDNGINFFDTAEMYPVPVNPETQGRSERFIGSWLKHQRRDQIIIATKIIAPGRGLEWIRGGDHVLTERNIAAAVEGSLNRLGTDYIDLYQIHWPERYVPTFGQTLYDPAQEREATPIQEQLQGFQKQVEAGKIRYLGLSNETPWGVFSFCRAAEKDLPKVVSVQNAYSLLNRTFETDLAETCHHEKVGLLAYSPLAFGLLTGKYLTEKPEDSRLRLFADFGNRYSKQNVDRSVRAYAEIARTQGIPLTHLALAFIRHQPFVCSTLIGTTKTTQLRDNLDSLNLDLDPQTLQDLEQIHRRYPNPAP